MFVALLKVLLLPKYDYKKRILHLRVTLSSWTYRGRKVELSIEKRAGTASDPAVPEAETHRGSYEELRALGSQRMLPEAVSIPQAPAALSMRRLRPNIRQPTHHSPVCLSFIIHPHTRPSVCHRSSIPRHSSIHPLSYFSCQPSLYALDKPL